MRLNFSTIAFSSLVIASIAVGWNQREEYWLTAEKGWGYALGIIGGSMMLVLLLYPVRKHWRLARNWFSIRHWFKMHMLFGILGPLLILFHSNFHLGSLNSNIALFSMLLVSSSGLIGRYAYQKIHRGLYGKQIQFTELKQAFDQSKEHLEQGTIIDARTQGQLSKIESNVTAAKINFFQVYFDHRQIRKIIRVFRKNARVIARRISESNNSENRDALSKFAQESKNLLLGLQQLQKMANHALYARLFSLWHLFHLPIFFMMIIAGIVHVFAVHMY